MRQRIRSALATLSSAPWRRAPWLLRRRPGVLATVAGASAVLAASAAAVPLFLSSVGSESVAVQAAERCPRDTGASLRIGFVNRGNGSRPDLGSDPFAAVGDQLGPPVRWLSWPVALERAATSRSPTPIGWSLIWPAGRSGRRRWSGVRTWNTMARGSHSGPSR